MTRIAWKSQLQSALKIKRTFLKLSKVWNCVKSESLQTKNQNTFYIGIIYTLKFVKIWNFCNCGIILYHSKTNKDSKSTQIEENYFQNHNQAHQSCLQSTKPKIRSFQKKQSPKISQKLTVKMSDNIFIDELRTLLKHPNFSGSFRFVVKQDKWAHLHQICNLHPLTLLNNTPVCQWCIKFSTSSFIRKKFKSS